jgi:hypothetical protein
MPEFQLPVAISLAIAAGLSAVVYGFDHGKTEGKIKLAEDASEGEYDPFNVVTPQDVIDGEPLNETKFWANVCTYEFCHYSC